MSLDVVSNDLGAIRRRRGADWVDVAGAAPTTWLGFWHVPVDVLIPERP